jgi:hypothetical protein
MPKTLVALAKHHNVHHLRAPRVREEEKMDISNILFFVVGLVTSFLVVFLLLVIL